MTTDADPRESDERQVPGDGSAEGTAHGEAAPAAPSSEPTPEPTSEPTSEGVLEARAQRIVELEDRVRRLEAEFVNETRRIRRQSDDQRRYAAEKVVVDLLPVLDALHSAGASVGEGDDAKQVRAGLDLVSKQLSEVLGRHGIERIDALDQPFDPSKHEAMLMVEDPARPSQTVCQEMSPGYALHGRVIRAAQVVVVKGSPASAPTEPASEHEEGDDAHV